MYIVNYWEYIKKKNYRCNFRQIFVLLILVFLLCGKEIIKPVLTNAASKKNIHMAYEKIIDSLKSEVSSLDYIKGDMYFTYYDINHDGTDELFVQYAKRDEDKNSLLLCGGTDVVIYTYANGQCKELLKSLTGGGTWGGYYFGKNNKYITRYERGGWSDIKYVFESLSKGKLVKKGSCSYSAKDIINPSAGFIFKINGKKVSEKKYNKYLKNMRSAKKLRMYKATDANLGKMR